MASWRKVPNVVLIESKAKIRVDFESCRYRQLLRFWQPVLRMNFADGEYCNVVFVRKISFRLLCN